MKNLSRKKSEPKQEVVERASQPALTPEAREKQLTALAVDLAEKQLREGTASPSVINHFLKIASQRETLEREILQKQAVLIQAKAKDFDREREHEEIAKQAIEAMSAYSPS